MKATMFAVVLSFFVVSISTQVIAQDVKNTPPPSLAETGLKKISINQATVQDLTGSFKGIGKKRAETIVSYRETHGAYKSIEELAQVRGLGKAFVEHHLTELQAVFSID